MKSGWTAFRWLWVGASEQSCPSKCMEPMSKRGRTFNVESERLSIIGGFGDADTPWHQLAFEAREPFSCFLDSEKTENSMSSVVSEVCDSVPSRPFSGDRSAMDRLAGM